MKQGPREPCHFLRRWAQLRRLGGGEHYYKKKNSKIENLQFGFQLLCILYKVGDSLTPRPPSE